MKQIEGAEALAYKNGLFTFHNVFEHSGRLFLGTGKGYAQTNARWDDHYTTSLNGLHVKQITGMLVIDSLIGIPVRGT